jgi:hypothetical protein
VEDLTEILQDNLPAEHAKDNPKRLARDCARNETDAVDAVNEILSSIDLDMDHILNGARVIRAKELVKEYVRGESGAVALIDDLLAKDGTTIDGLIVPHLRAKLEYIRAD